MGIGELLTIYAKGISNLLPEKFPIEVAKIICGVTLSIRKVHCIASHLRPG
jgi:hypothetical protein